MKEKTIIFFDVWTKGSHHYKELSRLFLDDNINIVLLHFGSYGDEIKKELITEVNRIKCYDMKYFHYKIDKAINNFKPIAILYLSIDPLIMRACNLYALKYNIKTFLTYPGLWSAQDYNSQRTLSKKNLIEYTKWIFSRSYNYLINALPQYAKALIINNNKFKILISFLKEEFNKLIGKLEPRKSLDKAVNTVFVYNYYDKFHAEKKFKGSNIHIVGVPDLFRFGNFLKNSKFKYTSNELLYLGSGSRSRGMLLKHPNDYFIYLMKIKSYFKKFGKHIKFKLHISTKEEIKKISRSLNKHIEIVENEDFFNTIHKVEGCITEPSSISLVPIYLGLKLFGTRMYDLEKLNYGESIKNYKLFSYINEKDNLTKKISELNTKNEDGVFNSINKICGSTSPLNFSKIIYEEISKQIK